MRTALAVVRGTRSTGTMRVRAPRRSRVRRIALLAAVAGLLAIMFAPVASAAPVGNLNSLPASLAKYVPNSPAWNAAPWMTSPTCKGKGGDFAIWARTVVDDTPSLLAYFQSSAFGPHAPAAEKPLDDEVIAGYKALAQQLPSMMPTGSYCVNDLKTWAGATPSMKPFGFPWGVDDAHQSQYFCTDLTDPDKPASADYNKYFGAERAPCTGFYVSCAKAPTAQKLQCSAWDTFTDEFVQRVDELHGQAINDHPAVRPGFVKIDGLKSPGQIAGDLADSGFSSVTTSIAQGAATMLADSMTWWTTTDRSTLLQSPAIAQIQSLLRYVGVVLLVGSMIWQGFMMIVRRKLDPLVSTARGLVSFVGWSTLGGTGAVLLNQAGIALADQVLSRSIDQFANSVSGSLVGLVTTATGAVFLLAIILFLLSVIQWALGFFRMGALVILLSLLPTAAAGQINESTQPWVPTLCGWCLTLECYQPVAAVCFASGFTMIGSGGGFSTVMVGLAVIMLSLVAMPTMLRFFNWGGRKFAHTGSGGGGAMAAGAAASMLGGGGAAGFGRFMEQNGPAGGGRNGGDVGAAPVTSAHGGDGPSGGWPPESRSSKPGATGGSAESGSEVSSAAAGAGQPASTATGAGEASGGATAGGAATGGVAAVAGPAGAAVAGVQAVKAGVAAAGSAMTDGAGESEGSI
jgi:hypothetical protein